MNTSGSLGAGIMLLVLSASVHAQDPRAIPAPKPPATVSAEAAGIVVGSAPPSASGIASARPFAPTSVIVSREVFDYARTGRRDPYKSLMTSSDVRPLISDLKLTSVAYDASGEHSVAILRDLVTKERYLLKIGQRLGRLRVVNIKYKSVVFAVDEFGFNRQETLTMTSDTTKTRTP
jgi:hypothetical protein